MLRWGGAFKLLQSEAESNFNPPPPASALCVYGTGSQLNYLVDHELPKRLQRKLRGQNKYHFHICFYIFILKLTKGQTRRVARHNLAHGLPFWEPLVYGDQCSSKVFEFGLILQNFTKLGRSCAKLIRFGWKLAEASFLKNFTQSVWLIFKSYKIFIFLKW